jgi:hypothetical protein
VDWAPLSDDDRQSIQGAYDTLTRLGNETAAADGTWDDYLDQAHQDLGVILALNLARSNGTSPSPP